MALIIKSVSVFSWAKQKKLSLYLPKDVGVSQILADNVKALPLQDALLKVLQVKYPC